MPGSRLNIVRKLLSEFPIGQIPSEERALTTWWHNLRTTGGMRLTDCGYKVFTERLKLESWTIDIKDVRPMLYHRTLLEMDRKLQWPYYIDLKNKCLVLFSSKDAVMATLQGDVLAWIAKHDCRDNND